MKKVSTLSLAVILVHLLLNIVYASQNELMAAVTADFQSNVTLIATGNSVNFMDMTAGDPVSWSWTFEGGTPSSWSGQIPPAIYYNTSGEFNVTLEVADGGGNVSIETKIAYIDVDDVPTNWDVTQTSFSHLISVPLSVTVMGDDLAYGDFLGVFYLDENNQQKCGGLCVWDGTNNKVVTAFGNDITTNPIKDGFSEGEEFMWKVYFTASTDEKDAFVTYNQLLPSNDGTYTDNGLSSITEIFTGLLEISASATPEALCEGEGVQLEAGAFGGSGTYTYDWSSDPPGFSSTLENPVAYPIENTTYTVEVDDGIATLSDDVSVTVSPAPEANAGDDQSICIPDDVLLLGTADNYSSTEWVSSGSGSFDDAFALSTTYYPSSNDIDNGSVDLTLIASPIDPCEVPANDVVMISLQQQPTASAGTNQTICEDNLVTLNGTASNHCGILWSSGGNGDFDDPTSLTPTYTPDFGDISQGSVQLCIIAMACSPCSVNANDCLTVSIQKQVTVQVGNDISLCGAQSTTVIGNATNNCGLEWVSSGDGTFSSTGILSPEYFPGDQDVEDGTVELCLYANPCNPCDQTEFDCLTISIQKQPVAEAGESVTICEDETVQLGGFAENHCGILWSSDGNGNFDDTGSLSAVYFPDLTDIDNGNVELCLTAVACDPCLISDVDCMDVSIIKQAEVNAGSDASICEGQSLPLSGTASNYCSLLWTTSGTGSFSDATIEAPVYYPSLADIELGQVELCLQAESCDGCAASPWDCLTLTIQKLPTVSAGDDELICEGDNITLNGSAENYCDLMWGTDGDGAFSNEVAMTPVYYPGENDIANGGTILCFTVYSCNPCNVSDADCITLDIQKAVQADAGTDATICEGEPFLLDEASVQFSSQIQWTSSGNGVFSNDLIENPIYTPSASDYLAGCVTLTLVASPIAPCEIAAFDDMELCFQAPPEVYAGEDVSLCEDETHFLGDAVAENYQTLIWTNTGDGTFDNVNIPNPTYYPGVQDLINQTVTLKITIGAINPCLGSIDDEMMISLQPKPSANAGDDATVPEDTPYTNTDAAIANYSNFFWSSEGDGSFNTTEILNTTYFPGAGDLVNGSVDLCLTAEAIAPCEVADVDCLTLVVGIAPSVFAGPDASICLGDEFALDQATADNYSSIEWESDGDGTFNDPGSINPVYYPGTLDESNGSVELCITAQPNPPSTVVGNNCMVLTIQMEPTINIGADQTICEGESYTFNETVASNYELLQWTSVNGNGFFNNEMALKPTYTPAPLDYMNGCIIIQAQAMPIDPCTSSASDQMTLCFQLLPTAIAGNDATICVGESVELSGQVTEACGQYWETEGDGSFDDFENLITSYYPGSDDMAAGFAEVCLYAIPCSPCTLPDSDCLTIFIQAPPTSDAGEDGLICENETYTTNGVAENYSTILWTSTGDGSFDDATSLQAEYFPSSSDIDNLEVTLCMEAFPIDPCTNSVTDCLVLTFQKLPDVFAGEDATICENEPYYIGDAYAFNTIGVVWSSINGSNNWDDETLMNPTYFPGAQDVIAGCVELFFVAASTSPCFASVSDTMILCIQALPIVYAGNDQSICEGDLVNLSPQVIFGCGVEWTSNGTGSFDDPANEFATYTPGQEDVEMGIVELYLDVMACDPCTGFVSDTITLFIQKGVEVFAGQDAAIAEGQSFTITDASAANYSLLEWSSEGDGQFDNAFILNPTYSPGPDDVTAGFVDLCLNVQPISPCTLGLTDCLTLEIGAYPVVSAGNDQLICEDQTLTLTEASATDYQTLGWTSNGDGTFDDSTSVNPTYYPGLGDLNSDGVELCVTAMAIPPASGSVIDCMELSFQPGPTINAGDDATVCEGDAYAIAGANGSNYGSIQWTTTTGSGEFINQNGLNATYIPSFFDYIFGCVTLQITVSPINPCSTGTFDSMELCFQSPPQVDAGLDATTCETGFYDLNGTVANECGFEWESSGDGTFSDSQLLNATYFPGNIDKMIGFAEICLNAYPCDPCTLPISDCIILFIQPVPTANAGSNAVICEDDTYQMNGFVENECGVLWETTGDGVFDESNQIDAIYTPGVEDIENGFTQICLTAYSCDPCELTVTDCMLLEIQTLPTVDAGDDQIICEEETYQFSGVTALDYLAVQWFSYGSGNFNSATVLNPEYTPSNSDILEGCVTLEIQAQALTPCTVNATDQMELCFQQKPEVNVGVDTTICAGEVLSTNPIVENVCSYVWTTTGDGVFDNNFISNPVYTPGAEDEANGSVNICLIASGCDPCINSNTDCLTIFIQKAPSAYAGPDDGVLAGNSYTLEDAEVDNNDGLFWETSGDGQFENAGLLNATYNPGPDDEANFGVELCLNAQPINPCETVAQDCMVLQIGSMPVITAGPDVALCDEDNYQIIGATAQNFSLLQWVSSGDGTFDDVTAINPVYFMGPEDLDAGVVELCMTAEPVPPATISATDCMLLSVVYQPTAFAGEDASICGNETFIPQAAAENYCEILWTTTGDGEFDQINDIQPTYIPGSGDINNGFVELCIEALPCNPCVTSAFDCTELTIGTPAQANAGNDVLICENATTTLSGSVLNQCDFYWETNGDGTFSDITSLSPVYTPGDLDKQNGYASVCLVAIPCEPCLTPASDCAIITLQMLPQPNPGPDASICFGDTYDINATLLSGCGFFWQTSGDGNFTNPMSLTTTYVPGPNDYNNGSVALSLIAFPCTPCSNAQLESMTLSFVSDPSVDAGDDATVCSTEPYTLQPTINDACDIAWQTSGDGTFDNSTLPNAQYFPGVADVAFGSAELCITGLPCGSCETPDEDCMTLYFIPGPIVEAGADATICENTVYPLTGIVSNDCGIMWTTAGDGTFDNALAQNAVYTPGTEDYTDESVILTLTAQACDPCINPISDELTISFTPQPFANAGADASILSGEGFQPSEVEVMNSSSFIWSTDGDGMFDDAGNLEPTYTPGSGDIADGSVELCLTAFPIDPCLLEYIDCLVLSIGSPAEVNAGPDVTICGEEDFIISQATANNYSTLEWSTLGDGTFSTTNVVNPVYYPGNQDKIDGEVVLCIAAEPFPPATLGDEDCMNLTIQTAPTANAGGNVAICEGESVQLSGLSQNNCGVYWTTSGTGTFDDITIHNATYYPSALDANNGVVELCLTAEGCFPCEDDIDCLEVTINKVPTANAGANATICEGYSYTLQGSVSNECGFVWESSGSGTFNSPSLLNASYTPSIQDIDAGSVQLCLTAQGCDPCPDDEDCMTLYFQLEPVAHAGSDATVCVDEGVLLTGLVENACGFEWQSNGDGFFDDPLALNAFYMPGIQDTENGYVSVCLTAEPCDPCFFADEDCMIITILGTPIADAGDDFTICEGDPAFSLNGFAENACDFNWTSSGDGTFDDPSLLDAKYFPGEQDVFLEIIELCLEVEACDPCSGSAQDCMTIQIVRLPVAHAGDDMTICDWEDAMMAGASEFGCITSWAPNGDGFFDDPMSDAPMYTPGPQDIANGFVVLCMDVIGCDPCATVATDCLTLYILGNPVVDAGDDAIVCSLDSYALSGEVTDACGTNWTTNGTGTFENASQPDAIYYPSQEDFLAGSVNLCLNADACFPCFDGSQDCMTLTFAPLPDANAGDDDMICEGDDYTLNGSTENGCTAYWTTSGTGTFDDNTSFNPLYIPSLADIENEIVTLTLEVGACDPCTGSSEDSMELNIVRIPQAFAGDDETICETEGWQLSGAALFGNIVSWNTLGSGSFDDPNIQNPTYYFSPTDIAVGSVELCMQVFGMDPCNLFDEDCMTITIQSEATVFAGEDIILCEGDAVVMNAIVDNACGYSWTTFGDGEFSDITELSAAYFPGDEDLSNGSVELCLTASSCDPCAGEVTDCMVVDFVPLPQAFAGDDETICETEGWQLSGAALFGNIVSWNTLGSGSFDDPNIENPTYYFSPTDIAVGSVELCMQVFGMDPCNLFDEDCMTITIQSEATVFAGEDIILCEGDAVVMNAIVDNACGYSWTTFGDGEFSDITELSAAYTPGDEDLSNGSVELCLTASSCDPCAGEVTDCMVVTFVPLPQADAGADQTICESESVQLYGIAVDNSTLYWTSSGFGQFNNNQIPDAVYTPSSFDIALGEVELCLHADPFTPCIISDVDCITVIIQALPTANAGDDGEVCIDGQYQLSGFVDNDCGSYWETSGDGEFSDDNDLNATYTPGSGDILSGTVQLCLTAESCTPCEESATSCMVLDIIEGPEVSLPADQTICEDAIYCIDAVASNYSSLLWTGGNGFDNTTILNPCYTPTGDDIQNGMVILTLTASPIDPCTATVSESMMLFIQKLPTANAGDDLVVCSGSSAQLTGFAENQDEILWSTSGDGNFTDPTSLNTSYTPGVADLQIGLVVLELTASSVEPCSIEATDALTLTIQNPPTIFAGDDDVICEQDVLQLNGSGQQYASIFWETSGDGNFSNPVALSTLYFPGANDKSNGGFTVTLNAVPIDPCTTSVSDDLDVEVKSLPVAYAGDNAIICDAQSYTLQGSIESASTAFWSTAGDGVFDDNALLNATYTPGSGDISAGFALLTLTAQADNPCVGSDADVMKLFITNSPIANAGADATICVNQTANLSGSASYNSGVYWSTGGDGLFNNPGKLHPVYGPGTNDQQNGSVVLTMAALPISPCQVADEDQMTLFMRALPYANAGGDITACYDNNVLLDETLFTNTSSLLWFTSNGGGTFNDNTLFNPTYFPNPGVDYAEGCISIGVVAYAESPCTAYKYDFMKICFQAPPTVDAGLDAVVCESNYYTFVTADADDYNSLSWSTSGDGSFADKTVVRADYYPGPSDIINAQVELCLSGEPINPCNVSDQDCMTLTIEPGVGPLLTEAIPGNAEVALAFQPIPDDPGDIGHWNFAGGNPINLWTIHLNITEINGIDVEAGDELAIFDGELLVGQTTFDGPVIPGSFTQNIQAYRELNDGPGYTPGNVFTFKFWDESLGDELLADSYLFTDPANEGLYIGDVFPQVDNEVSLADIYFINPNAPKFNIYLVDGSLIASEVYEYEYLVQDLENGEEYCFYVTQVLPDQSETCPSNVICAIPFVPCEEPTVFAGSDVDLCSSDSYEITGAQAENFAYIQWTTSGNGTFSDEGAVNPVYFPGNADLNEGSVELCVSAVGFYPCGDANDCLTITFQTGPSIDLGVDEDQICIGGTFTPVLTKAENYTSVSWFTPDGFGSFDDPSLLNPTYYPAQEDIDKGCITLGAQAQPIDPCTVAAVDELTLCLVLYPDIDAGADDNICIGSPYQLYGEAENYVGVIWNTSGDGTFDDKTILNPVYTPGVVDEQSGEATLTLTVYPESPCVEIAIDQITLGLYGCQVTNIPQGWSGISTYLDPADESLDDMFAPIMDELIILQDMESSYWPTQSINTIGSWDTYQGYKIKVTEALQLTIPGTTINNSILSLQAGWNLIPVLSDCPVDVEELFQQTGVVMVKEVAGWKLYWPELGINNLEYLQPGRSYYVYMENVGAIQFPDCDQLKNSGSGYEGARAFDESLIPMGWQTFIPSASSHAIGIPANYNVEMEFENGDVIGVFDNLDNCYGYTVWTGTNTSVYAFGDDPTTASKDGFYEDEIIEFRKYNATSGAISKMEVEFSDEYPISENAFTTNGVSVLKSATANNAGFVFSGNEELAVYPNPVNARLIVDYEQFENVEVRILNLQGQTLYEGRLTGAKTELDFSGFVHGVYLVHVSGNGVNKISRIIKQ